ncbi:hypothetical protein [Mycobacteroides abscessus]|uniref:hypothetical protein n=1 Tax=Mycobacteroides abscessus TaxID=36809 RepID=UPI001F2DB016|nr:hypothetical protein [Mycobacteroides abscessus]
MGNFAVIDIELLKERVVEVASDLAVAVLVQRVGVGDELQRIAKHHCAERELFCGGRQACFDAGAVDLDLVEFGPDLRRWQCAVGGEVDKPRFLLV